MSYLHPILVSILCLYFKKAKMLIADIFQIGLTFAILTTILAYFYSNSKVLLAEVHKFGLASLVSQNLCSPPAEGGTDHLTL